MYLVPLDRKTGKRIKTFRYSWRIWQWPLVLIYRNRNELLFKAWLVSRE